jgi:hypothetical protein
MSIVGTGGPYRSRSARARGPRAAPVSVEWNRIESTQHHARVWRARSAAKRSSSAAARVGPGVAGRVGQASPDHPPAGPPALDCVLRVVDERGVARGRRLERLDVGRRVVAQRLYMNTASRARISGGWRSLGGLVDWNLLSKRTKSRCVRLGFNLEPTFCRAELDSEEAQEALLAEEVECERPQVAERDRRVAADAGHC